jgi:hypothetical protein
MVSGSLFYTSTIIMHPQKSTFVRCREAAADLKNRALIKKAIQLAQADGVSSWRCIIFHMICARHNVTVTQMRRYFGY